MRRRTVTSAAVFTLAWPATVVAASGAVVDIGNSRVVVSPPTGFSIVSPSMSTLQEVGEFATPPENRLLALLATRDDIRASEGPLVV